MIRELLIFIYLSGFKIIYTIFRFCRIQKKITFVISFEENNLYLYREVVRQDPSIKVVLLYKSKLSKGFQKELTNNTETIKFESNLKNWIVSIYHISTSGILVIDNYYGFLSTMRFKRGVECIQIWHAAGALKTFGLADRSIENRWRRAHKRFRKVYSKFHKIVVGSEEMAKIFIESFGVKPTNILRTGIPRTDFFYNQKAMNRAKQKLYKKYPTFKGKKLILYAPTYRDKLLKDDHIHLDIYKMYDALHRDYILMIKTHPAVKMKHRYEELYPDFVFNLSGKKVEELLVLVDYLITDYSSLPFEFSILRKPMIFFPYDYDLYMRERGLVKDYKQIVPGPIAFTTDEIIEVLKKNDFKMEEVIKFAKKWNQYSDGHSSSRLATYLVNSIRKQTSL
jgi:teichoic acid glycerol-phosphate primase